MAGGHVRPPACYSQGQTAVRGENVSRMEMNSSGNERDQMMRRFLRGALGSYDAITKLQGDASTREYFRVVKGDASYILCFDPALLHTKLDSYPFYILHSLLSKNTIPVPVLYQASPDHGSLLLEDLGDCMVEEYNSRIDSAQRRDLYRSIIDIMVRIQAIRPDGSLPFTFSFDVEKLMFEFDFFIEHALCGFFGNDPHSPDVARLREEFRAIAGLLYRPELFVLNHRDYHSRNVMIAGGLPRIIDFQDARLGLPQYDAASLLRDSYFRLDDEEYASLLDYTYKSSRAAGVHAMERGEYDRMFDLQAFQRNVKAIGTFGYQAHTRGNRRYAASIAPTFAYLSAYCGRRPELSRAWGLLAKLIPE